MIPGEFIIKEGTIEYNKGKEVIKLEVVNTGDRPIQIGSHYHFYEVNDYLKFDREKAYGKRLDIPSGTAVRFEPGDKKEINLIVSSMRLDCIVSEIAKTSRGKAEEIINDARVFVNYENIMKSTKQIKEKDIITIRRIGKFKLEKIDGKTRNDRVKIIVSQYI